ncbi:hypothetical protein [Piscirickettsia litoralis]|nr:hypothetical protein [Piscirickettsia litoralis]
MGSKFFVETIGNASEEVIHEYVRNQLKVMDKSEKNEVLLELYSIK